MWVLPFLKRERVQSHIDRGGGRWLCRSNSRGKIHIVAYLVNIAHIIAMLEAIRVFYYKIAKLRLLLPKYIHNSDKHFCSLDPVHQTCLKAHHMRL